MAVRVEYQEVSKDLDSDDTLGTIFYPGSNMDRKIDLKPGY